MSVNLIMDEALAWTDGLLEIEYQAWLASSEAPSRAEYASRRRLLMDQLAPSIRSGLPMPQDLDETWAHDIQELVRGSKLQKRPIFKLHYYQHPHHGDLFRAFVGNRIVPAQGHATYACCLFFAKVDQAFQVISRYDDDIIPGQDGHRIVESDHSWIHHSGAILETLGDLVGVHELEQPDRGEHRIGNEGK